MNKIVKMLIKETIHNNMIIHDKISMGDKYTIVDKNKKEILHISKKEYLHVLTSMTATASSCLLPTATDKCLRAEWQML